MDSETRKLDPMDAARVQGNPPAPTTPMPATALPEMPDPAGASGRDPSANGSYPAPAQAPRPVAPPMFGSNNNIIPIVLIVLGALLLFTPLKLGDIFGSAIVLIIGLVFLYVYSSQGRNVGFLIPGAIMTGLGLGIVAEAATGLDGWVPLGLGLGFCAIWFMHRTFWWALIPGGIITLAGLQDLMDNNGFLRDLGGPNGRSGSWWPLFLVGAGIWLFASRNGRRRPR